MNVYVIMNGKKIDREGKGKKKISFIFGMYVEKN